MKLIYILCPTIRITVFFVLLVLVPSTASLSAQKTSPYPPLVAATIAHSPFPEAEWQQLLKEYKEKASEKYEATCFLLANMPLHHQAYLVEEVDSTMLQWLKAADTQYYSLVQHRNDTALFNSHFNDKILTKVDQAYRKATEAKRFQIPQVKFGELSDATWLSPSFIRQHIEHAFAVRARSPFAKRLSFQDFLHYILPYRAMENSSIEAASVFSNTYEKYLHSDTAQSIHKVIWRYNITAKRLRYWGGTYPFQQPAGACEMFFLSDENCANKVDRAALHLRACGIPVAVEYNIAYKIWEGRHFHLAVPTEKGWETFNPEESLPEHRNKGFKAALNIYRLQFAQQNNNPFSLRTPGEPIPESLSSPFIEDVTQNVASTFRLTLPFKDNTTHRLAYLGSFRASDFGLLPVTWGIIDQKKQIVTFNHVVPNHLYFPIYLDEEGDLQSFAQPFYIKTDNSKQGFTLYPYIADKQHTIPVRLECSYPDKPEYKEAAQRAVGTYVIASDDAKFTKADTIGCILKAPNTAWEDLQLSTKRAYQYYRVCGSPQHPKVYLGEIAFLSDRDTTLYTTEAPYNSQLSPEENARWKQLWDTPKEESTWKAEYDGLPYTAPDRWPDVTLRLQSPKIVNRLRYMAKHAGNTIEKGQNYELLAWQNGFWKRVASTIAETNALQQNLYTGQLYWLKSKHKKQDSMPFIVNKDGIQFFPQVQQ